MFVRPSLDAAVSSASVPSTIADQTVANSRQVRKTPGGEFCASGTNPERFAPTLFSAPLRVSDCLPSNRRQSSIQKAAHDGDSESPPRTALFARLFGNSCLRTRRISKLRPSPFFHPCRKQRENCTMGKILPSGTAVAFHSLLVGNGCPRSCHGIWHRVASFLLGATRRIPFCRPGFHSQE